MNYQALLYRRIKYERNLLLLYIFMFLVIFIGLIITKKMTEKTLTVFIIIFFFFIVRYFFRVYHLRSIDKEFTNEEKEKIDKDLNFILFEGVDYALSNKFIVDFQNCNIFSYDSILLINCVKKTSHIFYSRNFRYVDVDKVYVYTKNAKYTFISNVYNISMSDSYYNDLYNLIKEKNPNVLEGYTKENRKIIKEKYNVNI